MADQEVTTFIATEAGTIRVLIALNETPTDPTPEDPDGTVPGTPGGISDGPWTRSARPGA
jgi:hypothetical protein